MPIPTPSGSETQEQFTSRCHSALASEYGDESQRHAICMDKWRGSRESMSALSPVVGGVGMPTSPKQAMGSDFYETQKARFSTLTLGEQLMEIAMFGEAKRCPDGTFMPMDGDCSQHGGAAGDGEGEKKPLSKRGSGEGPKPSDEVLELHGVIERTDDATLMEVAELAGHPDPTMEGREADPEGWIDDLVTVMGREGGTQDWISALNEAAEERNTGDPELTTVQEGTPLDKGYKIPPPPLEIDTDVEYKRDDPGSLEDAIERTAEEAQQHEVEDKDREPIKTGPGPQEPSGASAEPDEDDYVLAVAAVDDLDDETRRDLAETYGAVNNTSEALVDAIEEAGDLEEFLADAVGYSKSVTEEGGSEESAKSLWKMYIDEDEIEQQLRFEDTPEEVASTYGMIAVENGEFEQDSEERDAFEEEALKDILRIQKERLG